jgi:predicted esterase
VAPTKTCTGTGDASFPGFFSLNSPMGQYWYRLPAKYDKTKPTPVVIGMHGCGDYSENFATWAMAPYNDVKNGRQNDFQSYIAISVEDTSKGCWDLNHADKVIAALDDAAACFYVDQSRVVVAGYSSGAGVAYKVGLSHAERFAGILIEDGGLYDNGAAEKTLLANAAWKINIAHMLHDSDPDYTPAKVQADWALIKAAGFPLVTSHVPGDHSGTSKDWYSFLIPATTTWVAP